MVLLDDIKKQIDEETQAYLLYSRLADEAHEEGLQLEEEKLRKIAMNEHYHVRVLEQMHSGLIGRTPQRRRAEEVLGRISQPLDIKQDRPFPKTYGYWVELAISIKEKDPTVGIAVQVNTALQHISDEDGEAEQSKRWLTSKAGKLGVE